MGLSRFTNVLEDSCVGSSALGRLLEEVRVAAGIRSWR